MNSRVLPTFLVLAALIGWASSGCDTRARSKSSGPPTRETGSRDGGGARKDVADASPPAAPEGGGRPRADGDMDGQADAAGPRARVAKRFSNGAPSDWIVDEFGIGQRKKDPMAELRRILGAPDAPDQCFSATTGKMRPCSNAPR